MSISQNDRNILRELGKPLAEIAALPIQQETVRLWKALNRLQPVRPMVMIDQIPWHEMNVGDELTLRTEDGFCRGIEVGLRQALYRWRHFPVDMVIEPAVHIGKTFRHDGFGITTTEQTSTLDPQNSVVGHYYVDQLKTPADLKKIRAPHIEFDKAATDRNEAHAREIFDGILDVRMMGVMTFFNVWDGIVQWHGVENSILDLVDRPEFIHEMMARLTDANLAMLDQYEAQGLLEANLPTIHCSGAYTDELPAPGFDPKRPRAKDVWTCGMAQIFSTVSPATHKEFELDYAKRWYERFGLIYYGCCEPLDDKIDIIRDIPRVRKISMSPWVDVEKGASRIGRDFVFSRKPSPAFLAVDQFDPAAVERDLRTTHNACQKHGCPHEYILKDISTLRYQPQRLWRWAETAMRVVKQ